MSLIFSDIAYDIAALSTTAHIEAFRVMSHCVSGSSVRFRRVMPEFRNHVRARVIRDETDI